MSGSIELTGAESYRIEVCEANIAALIGLFLDDWAQLRRETLDPNDPLLSPESWERTASALRARSASLSAEVSRRCRQALMTEPNLQQRQNLMGRILVQHLIQTQGADKDFIERFFSLYMRPILAAFEEILGRERFAFFNRVLHDNLLNNCVIHDLLESKVDWHGFYQGSTVALVLKQAQNIRRWMDGQEDGRAALKAKILSRLEGSEKSLPDSDLDSMLVAWGLMDRNSPMNPPDSAPEPKRNEEETSSCAELKG